MNESHSTFAGEELIAAAPARVRRSLADPETLALMIPDRTSHTRLDEHTLQCTVRPGFSFIRTSLQLTIRIAEGPDDVVAFQITSKGIGASMDVECLLRIADEDSASRITWEARVTRLSGLIAALSPALIRSAADKVIRDGWQRLREVLSDDQRPLHRPS